MIGIKRDYSKAITCSRCKEEKDPEEFPFKDADHRLRHSFCRACKSKQSIAWERIARQKGLLKKRLHRWDYNLTPWDLEVLVMTNGLYCRICDALLDSSFNIDHDHETGRIRGFLCFSCNVGLGHFKDRINLLKNAIDYLENR